MLGEYTGTHTYNVTYTYKGKKYRAKVRASNPAKAKRVAQSYTIASGGARFV